MAVVRFSEGFLYKGNEFLAGSTLKERNIFFLQGYLFLWIMNCYVVFFPDNLKSSQRGQARTAVHLSSTRLL